MGILGAILLRAVVWILGTVLGRGILQFLNSRGYSPERWINEMIQRLTTHRIPGINWIVAALIGFVCLGLWQVFDIGDRLQNMAGFNSVPDITTGWGGPSGICAAEYDATKLVVYANKYKLAMVCGIVDPTVDKMEDDRITFSKPFTIIAGQISIASPYSSNMTAFLQKLRAANNTGQPLHFQVWHFPLLVPNDVQLNNISTLSAFLKAGGKIYREGYFH